jgi:EpsI family protein
MAGLTLGAAYAVLFVPDGKTQTKIIGLAAGVSIVSNWLRVFGLVLIAYATDMRSSLMQDHVVYGWLMFGGALPLFFFGAARIERTSAARLAMPSRGDAVAPSITDTTGSSRRLVAIVLATAAALVGPILVYGLRSAAPTLTVPLKVPGIAWSAVQAIPPAANTRYWQAGFRNISERRSELISSDGRILQVDRFIYGQQRQGAEMISSENRVTDDSLLVGEGSIGPLDAQARIVREAYVRDGTQLRVVWYWYRSAGVETASPMRAKLLELWAFFSRRDASEIVAVSTTCSEPTCVSSRNAMFLAVTGRPFAPSAGNR